MGKILFIVGMLLLMSSTASFGAAIGLPQTGQIACYDTSGTVISCTGTGQDGALQKGVPWPSPRFTITGTGDTCVLDNLTGLIWMRTMPGSTYTWQGALDYANGRNGANLCGFSSGWRLPNINELYSLLNEATWPPTTYLQTWFGTIYNEAWSSTTHLAAPTSAWTLPFNSGYDQQRPKGSPSAFYVLPVRGPDTPGPSPVWKTGQTTCWDESGNPVDPCAGGQDGHIQAGVAWPAPRFTVDGDCVIDNLTDLMWVGAPNAAETSWQGALNDANSRSTCGFFDWRLPNLVELRSLINYGDANTSTWLNGQGFTNVPQGSTWSSTTYAGNLSHSRITTIMWGQTSYYGKTNPFLFAWAVRDLAAPDISLSPGALDFGDVLFSQASMTETVTITNTGTADLVISSIEKEGTSPTMFAAVQGATNGCAIPNATVIPGGSCTLDVTFTPTALDLQEALLYINSNDPDTPRVQVSLAGTGIDIPAPIMPKSPPNGAIFDACSYFAPPLFQWILNQAFQKLEIHIFTPANPAKPAKVKVKDPTATQFQMTQSTWKKILKLPGLSGGELNWKIVGTNKGLPFVESDVLTMTIAAPEPAGKPDIDPLTHIATWGNSCGTKFKAHFSADSAFSKSKKLSFKYQGSTNSDDDFSVTLPDKTWASLEKLVEGLVPARLYFYVESWDIIKRYQKTNVAYIDLDI